MPNTFDFPSATFYKIDDFCGINSDDLPCCEYSQNEQNLKKENRDSYYKYVIKCIDQNIEIV